MTTSAPRPVQEGFTATATSVEGSGWAALTFSRTTGRLILVQVDKHNVNVMPGSPLLLVLDVWSMHTTWTTGMTGRSS